MNIPIKLINKRKKKFSKKNKEMTAYMKFLTHILSIHGVYPISDELTAENLSQSKEECAKNNITKKIVLL